MSFFMTKAQMYDQTKTVTRRLKWLKVKPGDKIVAIEKGQGLKEGEKQVVIGAIEVVSVRVELLGEIDQDDCRREGFPNMTPGDFVGMFGMPPDTVVRRIEFKHVKDGRR